MVDELTLPIGEIITYEYRLNKINFGPVCAEVENRRGVLYPEELSSPRHLSAAQHAGSSLIYSAVLRCLYLLELVPNLSSYTAKHAVISGQLSPESLLKPELITW